MKCQKKIVLLCGDMVLLEIPEFCEEVMYWGDTISYPGNDL